MRRSGLPSDVLRLGLVANPDSVIEAELGERRLSSVPGDGRGVSVDAFDDRGQIVIETSGFQRSEECSGVTQRPARCRRRGACRFHSSVNDSSGSLRDPGVTTEQTDQGPDPKCLC